MGAVGAVAFVVLLLLAIFFHELGHYVTARWAGVKIKQFFVGFGPTIWSFRRGRPETVVVPAGVVVSAEHARVLIASPDAEGRVLTRPETEYGVKALPLGGYVKILGFSAFEEISEEELPRSFKAISAGKQAIILVAGSATHFVTAFVLLLLVFSVFGLPDPERPTTTVASVSEQLEGGVPAPALAAGIRPGDRIESIDGRDVRSWDEVRAAIRANAERPMSMKVVSADGSARTLGVTPAALTEDGERVGVIGVRPSFQISRVNPIVGAGRSAGSIAVIVVESVKSAPKAFTPANLGIVPSKRPSDERPVSIYGAGRFAADLAAEGQVALFLGFVAQINVFIALFNMLPLPPLDGGHLVVVGIERIRGRRVNPRALMPVMAVVFTLLLVLGVTLLFQDIVSPLGNPFQ